MAEPTENKDALTEKLEEDRRKMAVQANELKASYNVGHWFNVSVREYPWEWVIGAVFTGFLMSRLPARKKEVYILADRVQRKRLGKMSGREERPTHRERNRARLVEKVWASSKPLISAYLGREIYNRIGRRREPAADRGRKGP